RPLVQLLMQRMLSSGVRTSNGDEADYFFIPFLMRKRAHTANHLGPTIYHIRKHWPWWDRHAGHRHLLVAPGDQGRRVLTPELLAMTANCTYLTHWGLHSDHPVGGWEASHRPGKDIVVPPLTNPDDPIVYSPLHPRIGKKRKRRVAGLFFAGRICGDSQKPVDGRCSSTRLDYSANTRQRMSEHHWNRPNWTITTHTTAYAEGLATHRFCLSPTGGGYGRRSVQALLMGCIPVTITDGLHQPFEPELRWGRFSVQLAERDIPYAHHILGALNGQDVKGIQGALRCAAQHMYFSSTFGEVTGDDGRYDAFETLMEVLRMRRDHPGLAPERYAREDARFADFANCRLGAHW
ncbi:putative glucuronosyltransferase, partial [Tetrabaena socialis]